MGKMRNRTRPTATFEERLAEQAQRFREMANQLPDGSKARDVLLRRARQMETTSAINKWLHSPEKQPTRVPEGIKHDRGASEVD